MPNQLEIGARVWITSTDRFANLAGTVAGEYDDRAVVVLDCEAPDGRLFPTAMLRTTGEPPVVITPTNATATRSTGKRSDMTIRERMNSICPECGNKVANCECLERKFLAQVKTAGLPIPERQFLFARPRRFAADFAWPDLRLLVEVEGGGGHGAHQRGRYESDCRKYNLATILGWKLIRFSTRMIRDGEAVNTLRLAISAASKQRAMIDADAGTFHLFVEDYTAATKPKPRRATR